MAIRPKGEGKMRRSLIKILVLALILSVMLTALNYEPRANYDPEEKRFACIINYGQASRTGRKRQEKMIMSALMFTALN